MGMPMTDESILAIHRRVMVPDTKGEAFSRLPEDQITNGVVGDLELTFLVNRMYWRYLKMLSAQRRGSGKSTTSTSSRTPTDSVA